MLRSYLQTAFRHLVSQRLYSAINIFGLTVGLASCLLISLYVWHELSFESGFANADRIYRISRDYFPRAGARARRPASNNAPVAPALLEAFPEIEQTARIFGGRVLVSRGDTAFYENHFRWADNSLFAIFHFDWLTGDPKTALAEPNSIVLTESMARKYFGSEKPLGKTLMFGSGERVTAAGEKSRTPMRVTGVIKDLPNNTHLSTDALASLSTLPPSMLEQWNSSTDFNTYFLLRQGANVESVERGIPAFMDRHIAPDASTWSGMTIMNIRDIHLHSTRDEEWKPVGSAALVYGFIAVALLILLIACINFTNLSTARAAKRAREIGVRRALGAARAQLILQFLGEAVLTALFAMVLALAIAELLLPAFTAVIGTELHLGDFGKLRFVAYALGAAVLVGFAAGAYPAFYLSAFEPAKIVKGDIAGAVAGGAFRNVLVVIQFSVSIVLMITTAIVYQQTSFARDLNLGFDKDHIAVVSGGIGTRWQALKQQLLRQSGVMSVTASDYTPFSFDDNHIDVRPQGGSAASRIQYMAVDYDFFRTYRIDVVAGRGFSPEFGQDRIIRTSTAIPHTSGGFIVNESAARLLGWSPADAVGKLVEIGTDTGVDASFTRSVCGPIVGVVSDTYFESVHKVIQPMIYLLFAGWYPAQRMSASIRVSGNDLPATLDAIDTAWRRFLPDRPVTRHFLDADFDALYRGEKRQGTMFACFSLLAIFVACLGLFGLVSFTTERRTKEIGVRRVMGGSVWGIVMLFAGELGKLVLLANLFAWPIAYFVTRRWLADFAYRIDMSPWVYLGCGAGAFALAWLTVGAVAYRAASARPATVLRYE